MKVSVIVPCYRSAVILPELVERLESSMNELVGQGAVEAFEVLLVVDGGVDGTREAALDLESQHPMVSCVLLRRNFGQHNALVAGVRLAANDVVVTLDDDLQHPPEEIHILLGALHDPLIDLVYAVPLEEEHGLFRSLASRLVKRSLSLAGVPNAESVGAFRAFRTELRDGFVDASDSTVNLDVLLSWSTSEVRTVKVRMEKRREGRSSYSLGYLVVHTVNMVIGYGVAPLRLATWLGFAFAAIGLGLLVYVLVRFAVGATTVPGFTTLAALISVFAGAQMFTIGIIGEYLQRQHFRSMNRPMYVIRPHVRNKDPRERR